MNKKALFEISTIQDRFEVEKRTGEALAVRIAAVNRDEHDLNEKLNLAIAQSADVCSIFSEIRENLTDRAQVMTEFAEHARRMAKLCTQSAAAVHKLTL